MWLRQTTVPPYLKESPAALMLLGYYPDGVGISATDPVMHTKKSKPTGESLCVLAVWWRQCSDVMRTKKIQALRWVFSVCRLSALWSTCHVLLKLYVTSLCCNPVECLSHVTQTVRKQPLLPPCGVFVTFYSNCMWPASLAVFPRCVNLHNTVEHLSPFTQTVRNQPLSPPCVALVTFFNSYCMRPASLATLWGVCPILLKLYVTSLSCHPVGCLSHFTQTVCDQPLSQPCGVFVPFYSNCMWPASVATLWGVCPILLKLYVTSLSCHPVGCLSHFTQTVCDQPLLQCCLIVYQPPQHCGALVPFYSNYMWPACLATPWSTCHVFLQLYVTSLACSISLLYVSCMSASTALAHLSCFTQGVHNQPLLPPCGALVMFYSKCMPPASLATLWSTCHVLFKVYLTSFSCHPVEHLSHFTQNVHNQPLLQPCGALVMFYSHCMWPASLAVFPRCMSTSTALWSTCHILLNCTWPACLATLWRSCCILLKLYPTSLSCSVSALYVSLHNIVEHLSPFTQTVHNQSLLPPCGALVLFYSNCTWPSSLAVFPCCMSASTTLWSSCHVLLKLYTTSLSCHPVEHSSCFTQTVRDHPLLQYFLVVCQPPQPCGALVMFYSNCTQPVSLATLWSTRPVLLKLYVTILSCSISLLYVSLHNPVELLSCFTQSVHNQPLLPPCGALVMFYSNCVRPASLATLWSTCRILLKMYTTSLSRKPVAHFSRFTHTVRVQPLLQCFLAVSTSAPSCCQRGGSWPSWWRRTWWARTRLLPSLWWPSTSPTCTWPSATSSWPSGLRTSRWAGGEIWERWGAGGVEVGSVCVCVGGGVRRGVGGRRGCWGGGYCEVKSEDGKRENCLPAHLICKIRWCIPSDPPLPQRILHWNEHFTTGRLSCRGMHDRQD